MFDADAIGELLIARDHTSVFRLIVVDQIHFVDRDDDVRHTEQCEQGGVAFGLCEQGNLAVTAKIQFAHIDQHNCGMRGRCAGDHIARVLLVTGRVGDDVFTTRRGEVAIRDVDGDALFTFGFEAIGEQRKVNAAIILIITAVVFGLGHSV